jgi:hypothetical protein
VLDRRVDIGLPAEPVKPEPQQVAQAGLAPCQVRAGRWKQRDGPFGRLDRGPEVLGAVAGIEPLGER